MSNINYSYGKDLDLNLLRVFAVVAEEGSITRAASRLYVTQPAVSASMRRLTTFVGADLFTRQGRGLVLTNRGAELLATTRAHLEPLVAATMAGPVFEPKDSTATVRLGLADGVDMLLLPPILKLLRREAPKMQIVTLSVQFRTVEELLLSNKADLAVSVADDLPRSIIRQPLLIQSRGSHNFVCLYDPRFSKLPKVLSEREYFAREHVAVSYAGDVRGLVEDSLGKSRMVRVSVPAFNCIPDVVDGSPLLATVPFPLAEYIVKTRPHLRITPLPFALDEAILELLWSRVTDDDKVVRFVRGLVTKVVAALEARIERREKTKRPAPIRA